MPLIHDVHMVAVVHYLHGALHGLHVVGLMLVYGYIVDGHADTQVCVARVVLMSRYLRVEVVLQLMQKVEDVSQVRHLLSHGSHLSVVVFSNFPSTHCM